MDLNARQMAQQEIDRLWEELHRVEEKIHANLQQLLKATKKILQANKRKNIAILKEDRDRLVEYQSDLLQRMSAQQALLISLDGEVPAAPLQT
ncbi:g6073 [Coccomyxa elongata]